MEVMLKDVRLSFPKLFTPEKFQGTGDPRFSATFIIEPGSENDKAIKAACIAAAKDKWKDNAATMYKKLAAEGSMCYSTAEKTSGKGEVYDGFEGMHWLSAANRIRPTVLDKDKTKLVDESAGRPYGGCYVNAKVSVYGDTRYGARINASLLGVQFVRDGDSFGGSAPASVDEFEDLSAGADADDFAVA